MLRPHVLHVTDEFLQFEYNGENAPSEPLAEKGENFLRRRELLASSFDPRPCGKKTTVAAKGGAAPILPLMDLMTAGPVAMPRTVTDATATNRQPFKNPAMRVSNR
jgi:hypothetical protein